MTGKIEKLELLRSILQDPTDIPDDLIDDIQAKFKQERELRESRKKKEDRKVNVYTNKELGGQKKAQISLDKIPYDERNKVAAEKAGIKILELIDILKICHKDVTENGYFTKELKDQQEYILGLQALIEIIRPATDNKHIQGDWKDMFEPLATRLREEKHWTEDAEFVRAYRWQIFGDGRVENRYEYTKAYIMGDIIIPKINNVILISECFPFLKAFFKNHFETKYQMLQKRENDKKKRGRKNGKT